MHTGTASIQIVSISLASSGSHEVDAIVHPCSQIVQSVDGELLPLSGGYRADWCGKERVPSRFSVQESALLPDVFFPLKKSHFSLGKPSSYQVSLAKALS